MTLNDLESQDQICNICEGGACFWVRHVPHPEGVGPAPKTFQTLLMPNLERPNF